MVFSTRPPADSQVSAEIVWLAQFGHSHRFASGNSGNPPEPQVLDSSHGQPLEQPVDGSEAVLGLLPVWPHTLAGRLLSKRHTGSCEPAAPLLRGLSLWSASCTRVPA